ncbi:MAG: hypothetical protein ACRDNW_06880 [Trebonia sp.]
MSAIRDELHFLQERMRGVTGANEELLALRIGGMRLPQPDATTCSSRTGRKPAPPAPHRSAEWGRGEIRRAVALSAFLLGGLARRISPRHRATPGPSVQITGATRCHKSF